MNLTNISFKYQIKRLYYRVKIFILALRWIPQINLGDTVYYNGEKYMVINGVRSNSWQLCGLDNANDGWVRRKDCKKELSLNNIKHSFLYGWNFYMTSWFEIWCNNGIEDWVRDCNIWPWPFRKR